MYNHSRQKDFCWGALIGGAVATLTSLLFTTKTGKQIQRKVADAYEDVEDTVRDTFSDAKDKVEEGVEHVKKASHKKHDDSAKESK